MPDNQSVSRKILFLDWNLFLKNDFVWIRMDKTIRQMFIKTIFFNSYNEIRKTNLKIMRHVLIIQNSLYNNLLTFQSSCYVC